MLERVGNGAFVGTCVESLNIPDSVVELGDQCFSQCHTLGRVTFGPSSKLELIGATTFQQVSAESWDIPDSVVEVGEKCLSAGVFGVSHLGHHRG